MFRFFKLMIAFRKVHPSLARSRFWREDVRWYGMGHATDLAYDSRSLAFALHGGSQQDIDLYVMINAYGEELTFQIQEGATNAWRRVVDASLDKPVRLSRTRQRKPLAVDGLSRAGQDRRRADLRPGRRLSAMYGIYIYVMDLGAEFRT